MRIIESLWARTHVVSAGDTDDDAIVLLPGSGATSAAWAHAVEPLTKAGHRVIVPDIPGDAGLSVRREELATASDLPGWLDDLLDQLNVGRTTLVGHSYGAMVATGYAISRPNRVAKLVLVDPNSLFTPIAASAALHAIPLLARPSGARLRAFYDWESRGRIGDSEWLQLAEYAADSFPARRPLIPRRLDVQRLGELSQPISVLLAADSRYHDPVKVQTRILRALPDADVTTIPGVSHHMLPVQSPGGTKAVLAAASSCEK